MEYEKGTSVQSWPKVLLLVSGGEVLSFMIFYVLMQKVRSVYAINFEGAFVCKSAVNTTHVLES